MRAGLTGTHDRKYALMQHRIPGEVADHGNRHDRPDPGCGVNEAVAAPASRRSSTIQVIGASALGTLFEWYDFYLYGSLAGFIASHFFSGVNEPTSFIFALATFAVGFIVRPAGALIFGRIGDLAGRKKLLEEFGIDPSALKWKPMPTPDATPVPQEPLANGHKANVPATPVSATLPLTWFG